jgi:streptomycin 6-kinase
MRSVSPSPSLVRELAARWSLEVGRPFRHCGASWAAPARAASGEALVLKISWPHAEALHEPDGLRVWAGDGIVRLVDSAVVDGTQVLLLEACRPGTPLRDAVADERAQDEVVAGLLLRLWREPPAGHPFRPLRDMCEQWAVEFEERYARTPAAGRIDPGVARAGIALFRELSASSEREVLLCTDLHAGNVLAARREPWLVIDPKPYVGDPTYDVLQHLLNCPERLAADPVGLVRRMAGSCGLDADRLRLWLFARCVQESLGPLHVPGVVERLTPA